MWDVGEETIGFNTTGFWPGACNPITQEADYNAEASLGYISKTLSQKQKQKDISQN
jgi:hypothetical protein